MSKKNPILEGINRWQKAKEKPDSAIACFEGGNFFKFISENLASPHLHMYAGIDDRGKMVFYVLPSEFDHKKYTPEEIFSKVTTCEVTFNLAGDSMITAEEAKKRMNCWNDNFETWTPEQIIGGGLYDVFTVPAESVHNGEQFAFFALVSSNCMSKYDADLVIGDKMGKVKESFYDTVRPVPPFDPIAEVFYLLQLARENV